MLALMLLLPTLCVCENVKCPLAIIMSIKKSQMTVSGWFDFDGIHVREGRHGQNDHLSIEFLHYTCL